MREAGDRAEHVDGRNRWVGGALGWEKQMGGRSMWVGGARGWEVRMGGFRGIDGLDRGGGTEDELGEESKWVR